MPRMVLCAAVPGSGVSHRKAMLSSVRHFAVSRGYSVCALWGVTSGVAFCRFEELFRPIPGIQITNFSAEQINQLAHHTKLNKTIKMGSRLFTIVGFSDSASGDLFSWDLRGARALATLVPGRGVVPIQVRPSPRILAEVDAYVHRHGVENRLGIRVRVEESPSANRKPHRIKAELDEVIKSLVSIPWYTPVFVATDSEYIQQMLASHFADIRFLAKSFDLKESTGRYVHRQDKQAMFTFIKEVECLCRCRKIINIGRFLNDYSVKQKWLSEPYRETAAMDLVRV